MLSRLRRKRTVAALVLTGGFLMSGIGTTCSSWLSEAALGAADSSFVFDCETAVGGIFDLSSFFIDCGTTGP